MANVVSIGFDYRKQVDEACGYIEKQLDKVANSKTLGKSFEKQIENVKGYITELKNGLNDSFQTISKGKLDTEKFDAFRAKVSADFKGVDKRIDELNSSIEALNKTLGLSGDTVNLSGAIEQFKELQNFINTNNEAVNKLLTSLKNVADVKVAPDFSAAEATEKIDILDKRLRQLNKGFDFSKTPNSELNSLLEDASDKFNNFIKIKSNLEKELKKTAPNTTMFTKINAEISEAEVSLAILSEKIGSIIGESELRGKSGSEFPKFEYDKKYEELINLTSRYIDTENLIKNTAKRNINELNAYIKGIEETTAKVSDKITANTGEVNLSVKISTSDTELKNDILKKIEKLQGVLNNTPLILPVKMVVSNAKTTSDNPLGTTKGAIKKYRKELNDEATNVSMLTSGLYKQTLRQSLTEAVSAAKESLQRVKELFEKNPIPIKFTVTPEEIQKITDALWDNTKGEVKIDLSKEVGKTITKVSKLTESLREASNALKDSNAEKFATMANDVKVSISALSSLKDILVQITQLSNDDTLVNQWTKIQLMFKAIADDKENINLSKQKKDLTALIEEYQKYIKAGGNKPLKDLTENEKTLTKLTNLYTKINEASSKTTDGKDKYASELDSINKVTGGINDLIDAIGSRKIAAINQEADAMEIASKREITAISQVEDAVKKLIEQIANNNNFKINITPIINSNEFSNAFSAMMTNTFSNQNTQLSEKLVSFRNGIVDIIAKMLDADKLQSSVNSKTYERSLYLNKTTGEYTNPLVVALENSVPAAINRALTKELKKIIKDEKNDKLVGIHTHPMKNYASMSFPFTIKGEGLVGGDLLAFYTDYLNGIYEDLVIAQKNVQIFDTKGFYDKYTKIFSDFKTNGSNSFKQRFSSYADEAYKSMQFNTELCTNWLNKIEGLTFDTKNIFQTFSSNSITRDINSIIRQQFGLNSYTGFDEKVTKGFLEYLSKNSVNTEDRLADVFTKYISTIIQGASEKVKFQNIKQVDIDKHINEIKEGFNKNLNSLRFNNAQELYAAIADYSFDKLIADENIKRSKQGKELINDKLSNYYRRISINDFYKEYGNIPNVKEQVESNTNLGESWQQNVKSYIDAINGSLSEIEKAVNNVMQSAADSIKTSQEEMFKNLGSNVVNMYIQGINESSANLNQLLADVLQVGINAAVNTLGNNVGLGYAEGIRSSIPEVENAIKEMIQAGINAAADAQQSHSPSEVFRQLGRDAAEGYFLGIKDKTSEVVNTTSELITTGINSKSENNKDNKNNILSDNKTKYDELISGIKEENEEIRKGNKLFQERNIFLDANNNIIKEIRGQYNEVNTIPPIGLKHGKVVHTHPDENYGGHASISDIVNWGEMAINRTIDSAELIWRNKSVNIDFSKMTANGINEFIDKYSHIIQAIVTHFGEEVDGKQGKYRIPENISDVVNSYIYALTKPLAESLGGKVTSDLDVGSISNNILSNINTLYNQIIELVNSNISKDLQNTEFNKLRLNYRIANNITSTVSDNDNLLKSTSDYIRELILNTKSQMSYKDKSYLPEKRTDYEFGHRYTDEEYEAKKAQIINQNYQDLVNTIKSFSELHPTIFEDLFKEANKLNTLLSPIISKVNEISKMSSIKNVPFDDIANEAARLKIQLDTLYDEGKQDSIEFIAAQMKIIKLLDAESKSYGGVKGSGAGNIDTLRQWIFNSWSKDTGADFSSVIDYMYAGRNSSIFNTSNGKVRSLRDIVSETFNYPGGGFVSFVHDEERLKDINNLLKIIQENISNVQKQSKSSPVQLFQDQNGQLSFIENINSQLDKTEQKVEEISNKASQIPGQISIDDYLREQSKSELGRLVQYWHNSDSHNLSQNKEVYEKASYFNTQTGQITEYIQGEAGHLSQELIDSVVNNAKIAVDGAIHTHGDWKTAAFSATDLKTAYNDVLRGIKTQILVSMDEVMTLDLNGVKGFDLADIIAKYEELSSSTKEKLQSAGIKNIEILQQELQKILLNLFDAKGLSKHLKVQSLNDWQYEHPSIGTSFKPTMFKVKTAQATEQVLSPTPIQTTSTSAEQIIQDARNVSVETDKSTESINKESEALNNVSKEALKASNAKDSFTASNKSLAESTLSSAEGIASESSALKDIESVSLDRTSEEFKKATSFAHKFFEELGEIASVIKTTGTYNSKTKDGYKKFLATSYRLTDVNGNSRTFDPEGIIIGSKDIDNIDAAYNNVLNTMKEIHKLQSKNIIDGTLGTVDSSNLEKYKSSLVKYQIELNSLESRGFLISEKHNDIERLRVANAKELLELTKSTVISEPLKDLENQFSKINTPKNLAKQTDKYKNKVIELEQALNALRGYSQLDVVSDKEIADADVLKTKIAELFSEISNMDKAANQAKASGIISNIESYLSKNTALKMSPQGKQYITDLRQLQEELRNPNLTAPQLQGIVNQFNNIKTAIANASMEGKSFFDIIKSKAIYSAAQTIARYFSLYRMFGYIRQAVSTIKELDDALVDLRKTAKMSTSELNEFYLSSNKIAKQMGVTTKEIISQASAWSRLGYSTAEQAEKMATLSSQFAAISPGMDVNTATDGLVSSMKAFGIEVDDVERQIMDNINRIGK